MFPIQPSQTKRRDDWGTKPAQNHSKNPHNRHDMRKKIRPAITRNIICDTVIHKICIRIQQLACGKRHHDRPIIRIFFLFSVGNLFLTLVCMYVHRKSQEKLKTFLSTSGNAIKRNTLWCQKKKRERERYDVKVIHCVIIGWWMLLLESKITHSRGMCGRFVVN